MRRPTVYRVVWSPNPVSGGAWAIKGAWKTVNSTMGFYLTREAAERALETMRVSRELVTVRKVDWRRQ